MLTRIDKFVAQTSALSRMQVKSALKAGKVCVNGTIVRNPKYKVYHSDEVELEDTPLQQPTPRYFMLNKPKGYISANTDAQQPTIIDLLRGEPTQGLQIAGRLDKDTTGLMLITDDGQWNHALTSPRRKCFKIYHVTVDKTLDESLITIFEQGILLKNETKITRPAKLTLLSQQQALLAIQEGKYHQVKRMFASVEYQVIALHRQQVGDIILDPTLKTGTYRPLTTQEIHSIYV